MQLSNLEKIITKKRRRLGQGEGSGRGKTSGRGTKGQKARNKIPIHFEGGAVSLIKRLPFKRGKGRNKVFKPQPIVINVKTLNLLPANETVTIESLVKHRLIDAKDAKVYGVKILGNGVLEKVLTVQLSTSKGAAQKIEKAGGRVETK